MGSALASFGLPPPPFTHPLICLAPVAVQTAGLVECDSSSAHLPSRPFRCRSADRCFGEAQLPPYPLTNLPHLPNIQPAYLAFLPFTLSPCRPLAW